MRDFGKGTPSAGIIKFVKVYDGHVIARFASSLRAGAGMMTLNMDEDGIAS